MSKSFSGDFSGLPSDISDSLAKANKEIKVIPDSISDSFGKINNELEFLSNKVSESISKFDDDLEDLYSAMQKLSIIENELNTLPDIVSDELRKWFKEKIYKTRKVLKQEKFNYIPYVSRRDVIWVDFGVNIGQEIKSSHPAVVLYSKDSSGTVVVVPLTTKDNENDFVVDIGSIQGMDSNFSHAKVDQIKSISKLRIQTKRNKSDGKYYNNINKKDGTYNNPKLMPEQIQKIDDTILLFRFKSK